MKTITVDITDEAEAILDTYEPGQRSADGRLISEALKLYRRRHRGPQAQEDVSSELRGPGLQPIHRAGGKTNRHTLVAYAPSLGIGFLAGVVFAFLSVVLAIALQQTTA